MDYRTSGAGLNAGSLYLYEKNMDTQILIRNSPIYTQAERNHPWHADFAKYIVMWRDIRQKSKLQKMRRYAIL